MDREIFKTASVTIKVLGGGEQSAYLEITIAAEGGVGQTSQKMRLMVDESYTINNVRLTVSGA